MISKEAGELMNKIQRLKTPENQQSKKIKNIGHSIIEYESKIKKWLVKFDFQMTDLELEVKAMRENEKKEEEKAVKEIDQCEISLKNLLGSYSKEAARANQKLNKVVSQVKQEMNASLKDKLKNQKQSMSTYRIMSEKLDKLIELVRSKQKKSIDDFERLKNIIRSKDNQISESNQEYLQEVSLQSQKLSVQLDELQALVDQQLVKIVKKYDGKVYETNKIINEMIQFAAEN